MRLKEFQMPVEPETDIFDEVDMQRIAAQATSGTWSKPMSAEEAIAYTMKLIGGGNNASTDSSM